MDEPLRRLLASFLADAATLMDGYAAGHLSSAQWERQMGRLIVEHHLAAYFTGRNTDDLSPQADRELGRRIQAQLDYLAGFASSLDELSEAQAKARAMLYGGALKATYSRAQHWDWPLPYHPGDGSTPCLGNCTCRWELDVFDPEELDADARWVLGAAERHCGECPDRSQRIIRIRGGALQ